MANIPFAIGQNQESLGLLAEIQPFLSGKGNAKGALPYGLSMSEAIEVSEQIRNAYRLSPQTSTEGFLQQNYYGANPSVGSASRPSSQTAEQKALDAAKGIVRDEYGNIIHDASASINETARAEDIARVQAAAGQAGKTGAQIRSQSEKNVEAANMLLTSINLKLGGTLRLTGGETYASLLSSKTVLEKAIEAEHETTGVSTAFGRSPQQERFLTAFGNYEQALLAQPTEEVLARMQPLEQEISLGRLREEAKAADVAFISSTFGYPIPLVEANFESGINFKSQLGKMSYSNLLEEGLSEARRTGKPTYIAGLGSEITIARQSVASSPLNFSPYVPASELQSRATIADWQRMGFALVNGYSSAKEGEVAFLEPTQYATMFKMVETPQAEPTFVETAFGNYAGGISEFYGKISNATVGPRGLKIQPIKGTLELFGGLDKAIEGQMPSEEEVRGEFHTSLSAGPAATKKFGLTVASGIIETPEMIYRLPQTLLITLGGLGELSLLSLGTLAGAESQGVAYAKKTGQAATGIGQLLSPESIIKTGTQILLLHTIGKGFTRPVSEVRLVPRGTSEVAVSEGEELGVKKIVQIGTVETEKGGVFSVITEGKLAKGRMQLRFNEPSTDLVRATRGAIETAKTRGPEVIMQTTNAGKVFGNIYGVQAPSAVERALQGAGETAYKFESGLIKRPETVPAPPMKLPEVPLGTFTAEYSTGTLSRPILISTESFGNVQADILTKTSGTLDMTGYGKLPFAFSEYGLQSVLEPTNPVSVYSDFRRLIEGSDRVSGAPTTLPEIIQKAKGERVYSGPQVPRPIPYSVSLTEGTIGSEVRFGPIITSSPSKVLGKGVSVNLFMLETKAGPATLSFGETYSLTDELNRLSAREPYSLSDFGRKGRATPSVSLTFNRVGKTKVGFAGLRDILAGEEPIPFEQAAKESMKKAKKGYAGYSERLQIEGNERSLLTGAPTPKLLGTFEPSLPPRISFGSFMGPVIRLGAGPAVSAAKGGTITKPPASKPASGTFVETGKGMGQIQIEKPATTTKGEIKVVRPKFGTKSGGASARPPQFAATNTASPKAAIRPPTILFGKEKIPARPAPPKTAETNEVRMAAGSASARPLMKFQPKTVGNGATMGGITAKVGERIGEKVGVKEKITQKIATITGLRVGQTTKQREGQRTSQREQQMTRQPQTTLNPNPFNPLNPEPSTPRIPKRRVPIPPLGSEKLGVVRKLAAGRRLVAGGRISGQPFAYADLFKASQSQFRFGKATSPSGARPQTQEAIRRYGYVLQTKEQLQNRGGKANVFKQPIRKGIRLQGVGGLKL